MYELSVVICAHNRADILRESLSSVFEQTLPSGEFEILVIDNASTDSTSQVVEEFKKSFPSLKYFYEDNLGLSHARNRGIKEATSDIVIFLDDDARAVKYWLEGIKNALKNDDEYVAVGGPIFLEWEGGQSPRWLSKHLEYALGYQYYGDLKRDVAHLNGGNLAFKKQSLIRYGGFNIELGRKGDKMLAAEESYLILKMRLDGRKILYVPSITVYHYVPLRKQKYSYFVRVYFGYGASDSVASGRFDLKNCLKRMWLFIPNLMKILRVNHSSNILASIAIVSCELSRLLGYLFTQMSILIKRA